MGFSSIDDQDDGGCNCGAFVEISNKVAMQNDHHEVQVHVQVQTNVFYIASA